MAGPWAHTPSEETGQWHKLEEHLRSVAETAKSFAQPFGAGDLAYWAGLWHDLGKFHPDFQKYLEDCDEAKRLGTRAPRPRIDHKGAGTVTAAQHAGPLAFLVAGHHGGLHADGDLRSRLNEWRAAEHVAEALTRAASTVSLTPATSLDPPDWVGSDPRRLEFFLRMLFSCLVDADFLDTEAHFQPGRAAARVEAPELATLWPDFEAHMQQLTGRDDAVGRLRDEVYRACLEAGQLAQGLFRLTVPTGGGKTLAGMAFALRHAVAHAETRPLERVIVAVPYTSITEQTAGVYRRIFGEGAVLEHHSAVREAPDPEEGEAGPQWERLAAENWDAPVIVTTTVRLFESLFARKPSDCRRLHRLARSVVILDEAQTLPTHLLAPILDGLHELTAHYGTSVVLCTATQPALDDAPGFKGLTGVREIAPQPARLFTALERVRYEWPSGERWSWDRVMAEMQAAGRALAVVNTKKDALALLDALSPDALHLSTLLCGAHRRYVLQEVRRRLTAGEPCLLVSTQVIEAGVDVDFPLVLRAVGPLDRIVQAAGRCNREGKLPEKGRVVVFEPEAGGMPAGDYETGAGLTAVLLRDDTVDPNDPAIVTRYFRELYRNVELDRNNIQRARASLDFPAVASSFQMIEDGGEGVLVGYRGEDEGLAVQEIVRRVQREGRVTRGLRRAVQPYLVSVRPRQLEAYQQGLLVEELAPGLHRWLGGYDIRRGLVVDRLDPDRLVV
jgi:CRISPR-associated endonuclease/helicase Cas3